MNKNSNIRTRLEGFFKDKHGSVGISTRRLLQSTKKIVHGAIRDAKSPCELYGYFLTVVWESDSRISAKLFKLSDQDSHLQSPEAFTQQYGYPLNFQILERNGKVIVYVHRVNSAAKMLVTSDKQKEIQDAVIAEVEDVIKEAATFLTQKRG